MNRHLPITLAVTGHRDLTANSIEPAREQIKRTLQYFLDTYPNTPLCILTALAEGADSLFAEVALDLRDERSKDEKLKTRIKVIAPLPLDKSLYLEDFSTDAANGLETLLARCDEHFSLAPYLYEGADEKTLSRGDAESRNKSNKHGYSALRNAQYANLGAFLVHHCQVLVALWDGCKPCNAVGGTHHIVNMMLNDGMDWGKDIAPNKDFKSKSLMDGGEPGVVIHIPVTRERGQYGHCDDLKNQQPEHHVNGQKNTLLDDVNWYYSKSFKDDEEINDDIIKMQRTDFLSSLDKTESMNALMDKYPQKGSWLGNLKHLSSPLDNSLSKSVFDACDTLAIGLQKKVNWHIILFFIALLATVVGYEIFSEFGGNKDLIADVSLGVFSLGVFGVSLLLWVVRKYKTKNNFHDARALAEAMRVTYFLTHARLYKQFAQTYHFNNQGEAMWLENMRKMVTLKLWASDNKGEETSLELIKEVQKAWVEDQMGYFLSEKTLMRLKKEASKAKNFAKYIYFSAVALLIALVAYYMVVDANAQSYVWAVGAVLALVAIIAEWQSVKGYKEDINRYEKALYMFQRANVDINAKLGAKNQQGAADSLMQLAYEALKENLKWYETHIGKQVSAPK